MLPFEDAFYIVPEFKESNRYVHHITSWQEKFGADRLLIMNFDELKQDPYNYIKKIGNFIGIPDITSQADSLKKPSKELLSRNRHLAYLGEKLGFLLRSLQAYKLLNSLKNLGLRKLLFEGGSDLPPMSAATAGKMKDYYQGEIEALEEIISQDLSAWK